MRRYIEYPLLFCIGAALYSIIEIIWRGYTHWTMGIAGGICLCAIYSIHKSCPDVPIWLRCLVGTALICAVEFAVGFVVNIVLKWNVWDYSGRWLNVYGQICPLYAFFWFFLCVPGYWISGKIERLLFGKPSTDADIIKN